MLAAVLGFVTFLLLLPARAESSDVDRPFVEGAADQVGETVTHCFTHLGWEDALGPCSCSRAAAAAVGVTVWLGVRWVQRLVRR